MRILKTVLYFSVLILGLSACSQSKYLTQSANLSKDIKAKYAPDSRTSIYKIKTTLEDKKVILAGETNIPEAKDALLQKMTEAQIDYVDKIMVLPDRQMTKTYGVVNLSVANLRSKPSVSSGLETQALMGMPLRILKKEGHWYFVQTPEKYIKWMNGGAFALMNKKEFHQWQKSQREIFIGGLGYAYTQPDIESHIVTDLLSGNIMQRINFDGDFTKVALPDGTSAFVLSENLMNYDDWLDSRALNATNIEKAAYAYMGAPYVWGGTSGKGLDCSGFTKNVFFQNGIMLPRDASQQVKVGQDIAIDATLSQLQKGDLLFFGRKATAEKKERVTHVAIYLGEGKIIHAGGPKARVAVESLLPKDPAFARKRLSSLLYAKRIIGNIGKLGIQTVSETMH